MQTQMATSFQVKIISLPKWLYLLVFLVAVRVVLSLIALTATHFIPIQGRDVIESLGINAASLPGVWVRWDSGYYLQIAREGYRLQSETVAFFPAVPFLIRFFGFGSTTVMSWAGFAIANLASMAAILLLWFQVNEKYGTTVAWGAAISISLFPTSLFFSAVYTEGIFLLFSILVYWFSARKQYKSASLAVACASLCRINGIWLAIIPICELLMSKPSKLGLRLFLTLFISSSGFLLWVGYLWAMHGSPLAFLTAQSHWLRSIVWPWQTLWNNFLTVIGVVGEPGNWFMRLNSFQDLSAAVLFIVLAVLAYFWLERSEFLYLLVALLFILICHGPHTFGLWSVGRYILILFPGFTVIGMILSRLPRLKWMIWSISALLLFVLTAWFATGRWVD